MYGLTRRKLLAFFSLSSLTVLIGRNTRQIEDVPDHEKWYIVNGWILHSSNLSDQPTENKRAL